MARDDPVIVWADGEVLVWGGVEYGGHPDEGRAGTLHRDGAVLSLDDGRWTPMPDAPVEAGLFGAMGAWDGTELVVIGVECPEILPPKESEELPDCPRGPAAAAFDPVAFTWRRLDPPPIPDDPVFGVPRLVNGEALGGEGQAIFVHGARGQAITWDRATEAWGSLEGPIPEDERSSVCADPLSSTMVVVAHARRADMVRPAAPARFAALPLAASTWTELEPLEGLADGAASCGAGHVTAAGLVTDAVDGKPISRATVIDLDTMAVTEAFAPSPDLRTSWIVGPWLFARSIMTVEDLDGEQLPHPTAVRQIAGGPTIEVQVPESLPEDDVHLPGIGVLSGEVGPDGGLVLWRLPDELQP